MTKNMKNTFTDFIERYIEILEQYGEPGEYYKYPAINTFQQNWDIEAQDFQQMFLNSFSKEKNLFHHVPWGFIKDSVKYFPEEVRKMYRALYDESIAISQRIKTFQAQSKELLPKFRDILNEPSYNDQQDERTIAAYLAFRYPEKYILYKADYYKCFCKQLNIKPKKAGERFLHFQALADEIIAEGILEGKTFLDTHRYFYPKPDWDDYYLMIQNIIFVVFRTDLQAPYLARLFKNFDRQQLEDYYSFLDEMIKEFSFQDKDSRLVFNADQNTIMLSIGQRQIWNTATIGKDDYKFSTISEQPIDNNYINFDDSPETYLCKINNISEAQQNQQLIFNAIKKQLDNTAKHHNTNQEEIKLMAFDSDFRNKILSQLQYHSIAGNKMNNTDRKTPLNQILFGAPGTGKTYHTKKMAVNIINGQKQRSREEINQEYDDLVNAKQIVFTTFHQSLSYEDFIEGIKPETTDRQVTYEIKDGIFKSLCFNANPKNTISFAKAYGELQKELAENEVIELTTPAGKKFSIALNKNGNLNLMTGDTRKTQGSITKEKILEYLDNEEFYPYWKSYFKGVVNYLQSAFNFNPDSIEKNKNYVLIIDEINRGNVSAIFGELITLLEEDKRKGNKEHTEVILPYSNDKFSVPNNVYVIGTMNTADRSVEALDTALRRRFSFIEMPANPAILVNPTYTAVDLKRLLTSINQRIEVLIDKDHQIGHSYFIEINNLEDLKQTFKDKIIPLLEEYFYGDCGKIGLVLGGSFIYQENSKAKFPKNFTYENDFLEDKTVYRFTPFEQWDENTFMAIYQD